MKPSGGDHAASSQEQGRSPASSDPTRLSWSTLAAALDQPRDRLVLRLTLLLLLLYGSSSLGLDVPLSVICGLMLIAPALLTNQILWLIICGLVWWVNATDWLWIDNHKYLISYWCLVCALAVSAKNTDAVLAWNGRWLIGLTFLFATLWKMLAGEYWQGSFLHFTFLTDPRVEPIAELIGQLDPALLSQNYLLYSALSLHPDVATAATLNTTPALQTFTIAASYWTLLIEASVAIAFLVNLRWLVALRDRLLITFIVTTYFLLPVLGFAYVLAIMGYAQCPPKRSKTRWVYLGLVGALQLARLPWGYWLL